MGIVYRATDLVSGELVAVKVLLEEGGDHLARFRREGEIVGGLLHPNVARRLDAGELPDGRAYLVLEWIEGMSLGERLAEGPLPVVEALELAAILASALSVVHADGVIHRDLKPSNVLLRAGKSSNPVIIDFGIARREDTALTRTGLLMGTPTYMAPEQATGDKSIDARADVWSLGCILYECLTGRAPFAAGNLIAALSKVLLEAPARLRDSIPDIPESVELLVIRMLAKDRAVRPRDGGAAATLLEMVLAEIRAESAAGEPLVATQPRSLLTAAEQRIVSVLLVSVPGLVPCDQDAATVAESETRRELEAAHSTPLPAEEVVARVRDVARAFGGHAEGLLGGVVLVKMTPSDVATDHAANAARCALALRALLPDNPMALAVGRALVQEGTLAGSVIDEAASLLLSTAPTPSAAVRLGQVAAGLLDSAFDVRGDSVSLVLVGEREGGFPAAPRPVLGVSVPFVGRRRELAFIEGLILECREDRRAQAVLVTAPPGLGKSRLAAELLGRLGADAAGIWWSSAEPSLTRRPFAVVARLVAHAAQLRNDEPPGVRIRKLRARFGRELSPDVADRVVSVLSELVPSREGTSPGSSAPSPSANTSLADQARVAWLELIEAESRTRPLLLVVDDFHWADDQSVRLLEAALKTCENHALTLLAAGRPEAEERFPGFIRDTRLQVLKLDRLSDEGSQTIVRAVCGADMDPAEVSAMLARSQGNAFFIEELLRARWRRDARVPDTLLAAVDARIDALSPLARRLIRAASVFGERFWEPAIQEMAGAQSRATSDAVQELVAQELVTEDVDSEYSDARQLSFRHALVREAAYARLTEEDRRRGHRLAGMWLLRRGARAAAVVARHLELGGEQGRAAGWHLRAAEQALERGDGQGALWHADHVSAAGGQEDLAGRLLALEGIARHDLGDGDRSLDCLTAGLGRLPPGGADWCNAFGLALPMLLDRRRTAEAFALCRTLLAAGQSQPSLEILAAAARAALSVWTHEGPSEATAELLALAQRRDSVPEQDRVLDALRKGYLALVRSQSSARQGDLGEVIDASEMAVSSFQEAGNLRRQANALNRLGDGLKSVGAYVESLTVLDQGLALVRRLGITPTEATITSNRGYVLAMLGRVDEAVVETARALDICTRAGIAFGVVYCRAYLARALLASGALADAERNARLAADGAGAAPKARPFAETTLAEVLLRSGGADEALARIVPIVAEAQGPRGVDEGDALAHLVHAEALAALGRQAEARVAIRAARDRIEERAARISHAGWRATFVTVPEHRRVLELAAAW
jgi:tetratricopeptide (TPR) repeat protein